MNDFRPPRSSAFATVAMTLFAAAARLDALSDDASAQSANTYGVSIAPEWNEKDELIRPKGFRHGRVYLGAPFTPNVNRR